MNKAKKIFLLFICIILLIIMYNIRVITSLLLRDFYFREYVKSGQQIYILGTNHDMSLTSSPFSYLNLKAVIENLKPDIVLVESRPEQLANGNLADGPYEALYSNLTAKSLNIPVGGIDWWDVNIEVPNSTDTIRDNHINNNILKSIIKYKKVLILIGNNHVTREQPKLEEAGYKKVFFPETKKIELFKIHDKRLMYPKGMDYYIQKRISYEKSCIGTVYKTKMIKDKAIETIQNFNDFSKAIEQTGELP